jgi:hypothetical protein
MEYSVVILVRHGGKGLVASLRSVESAPDAWVLDVSGDAGVRQIAGEYHAGYLNGREALEPELALGIKYPWVLFLEEGEEMTAGLATGLECLDPSVADTCCLRISRRPYAGGSRLRFHERISFPARLVRRELLLGVDPKPAPAVGDATPGELEDGIKLEVMPGGVLGWLEDCPSAIESAARARLRGKVAGLHPSWVDGLPRECGWATTDLKGSSCGKAIWSFAIKQTAGLGFLDGRAGWLHGLSAVLGSFLVYFRMREIAGGADGCAPQPARLLRGVKPASARNLVLATMNWSAVALLFAVLFFSWLPQPQLGAQVPMPGEVAHWVDGEGNWNLRTAVPFLLMGFVLGIRFMLERRATMVWALAWVGMVFIATVAELGQLFIPHRNCDAGDIVWAAVGSAAGLGAVAVLFLTAVVLRELRSLQALRS